MSALHYPHILKSDGDVARLERLPRVRVAMIVGDYLGRGWSAEEIVLQYPHLTLAEVHTALAYYHDHQDEIDDEMREELSEAERLRRQRSPLEARLSALKKSAGIAIRAERLTEK